MKKLLTSIVAGALMGVGIVQYFDRCVSPDIQFFCKAAEQSNRWAEKLRESDEPCYVICGSSDVRMGVDPAVMLEEGVRAINVAHNAGYGQNILSVEALRTLRRGDTLVYAPLSTESAPDNVVTGGMKIGFKRRGGGVFEPGLVDYSVGNLAKIFTGDMHAMSVYTLKKLSCVPHVYKYNDETTVIHESGWVEILPALHADSIRMFHALANMSLCDMMVHHDLSTLAAKCKEMGVDFVVRAPVTYGNDSAKARRAWELLQYTKEGYRVLKDPTFGVITDKALMADTPHHLNGQGAEEHSRYLALLLKQGEFWTEEELVAELNKRGWNADGTPIQKPEEQPAPAGEAE